jgi:hypothetical protein
VAAGSRASKCHPQALLQSRAQLLQLLTLLTQEQHLLQLLSAGLMILLLLTVVVQPSSRGRQGLLAVWLLLLLLEQPQVQPLVRLQVQLCWAAGACRATLQQLLLVRLLLPGSRLLLLLLVGCLVWPSSH